MQISSLLSPEHIQTQSDPSLFPTKEDILHELAQMLSSQSGIESSAIYKVLWDREQLHSTGIGEGIAFPHGFISDASKQYAAVLKVVKGVEFQAIDQHKVFLFVGLIAPKSSAGEHLKTLTQFSRLLRNKSARQAAFEAKQAEDLYKVLVSEDTHEKT